MSIHEQFHDIESFRDALGRMMSMRAVARRFGREVHCHRALLTANPMPGVSMQRAVGRLANSDQRRVAMGWLTRTGPFWDDLRQHEAGDWLECRDEIVTDTAVGEAGFRKLHGLDCGLISVSPSDWEYSPVEVTWRGTAESPENRTTALQNLWDVATLEAGLQDMAPPIRSWDDLRTASIDRFQRLRFSEDCFEPLRGFPFAQSAADRFLVLLGILDRLARAFDADGVRAPEGHQIYQNYFTGRRALFSDSSDTERRKFRHELTFAHPDQPGSSLFCSWHGKVSHLTLRLHFSWPVQAGKRVCVAYAGPKITKQ